MLARARDGNKQATQELYEWLYPRFWSAASKYERNPQTCDDHAQEIGLRLLKALPAFKATSEGQLIKFINTTAKRVVIDDLRKHGKWLMTPIEEQSLEASEHTESGHDPHHIAEYQQLVSRALTTLGERRPTCIATFIRIVTDPQSQAAMAMQEGRSDGGFRTHLWECRKEFRAILDGLSG